MGKKMDPNDTDARTAGKTIETPQTARYTIFIKKKKCIDISTAYAVDTHCDVLQKKLAYL